MYVGGCEVWGSGFGRWASPILPPHDNEVAPAATVLAGEVAEVFMGQGPSGDAMKPWW